MQSDDLANQRIVAELVGMDCLVSPSEGNWVSLYFEFEDFGDTTIATALSQQLALPVIDMWIYDSEAAGAALIVNGVEEANIEIMDPETIGYSQFDEFVAASGGNETPEDVSEMIGVPIDELLAVPTRVSMFEDRDGTFFIQGSAANWVGSLGCSSLEKLRTVTAARQTAAEDVLAAFLREFGLIDSRMLLAHRWITPTTDPEHASFIPGTLAV